MELLFPLWQQRAGDYMLNHIHTIIVSVMARVLGHILCKWLDRKDKDN